MSFFQIARPGGHDLLLTVQRHVHDELHVHRAGGADHVFVDGVALQHAGDRVGIGDGLVAVVLVDGGGVADAGQDALAPAGEAGEEVRLDEALADQQVAVHGDLVAEELGAAGQVAHLDEVVRLKGVVHGDLLVVHDGVAEHAPLLLLGGGPVQAGGDEDGDVRVRVAGADLRQQDGQGQLAGHSAGVVAGDQGDLLLAHGQLPQGLGADGVRQGVLHQFRLALRGLVVVHLRGDDRLQIGLVHMQVQRGGVVRNFDGFHRFPPSFTCKKNIMLGSFSQIAFCIQFCSDTLTLTPDLAYVNNFSQILAF